METSLETTRTLRVGIDHAPPFPLQIGDPSSGDFRGYEVDLMAALAEKLSYRIEYRRELWSVIVEELAEDVLDLICSAATVTEERSLQVDFCTPHLQLKLALVARQQPAAPIDLASARIGVRRGTTAEAYFQAQTQRPEPDMLSESNEELYSALARGEIDGVIDDSPIAKFFAISEPELVYAQSYEGTEASYAIAVRKGNLVLRQQINEGLAELERDGTLEKLRLRWFGSPDLLVA